MKKKTNPKIYKQALERSEGGFCEYKDCKSNHICELHHIIFGNGKRIPCERIESVMFLCWEHHHSNGGVHQNYKMDLQLKLDLQQVYFNLGMTEKEVRKWMGGSIYDN